MPQLNLLQQYSRFTSIPKGDVRVIKGFASTTGPENTDRSGEFVKSPFEFDLETFKNSPQLLLDHDYINTPEGNKVAAGTVTKAIPAYIKGTNPADDAEWVVHSLTSDLPISFWPKEKSATLAEGSQGLFIVAEVFNDFAIDLVDRGELQTFSWRGYALSEQAGEKVALKHIDPVEISIVHTQCERSSTFMLVDHDDPTNNLEIDFTDCEVCSMKFQKNIHTEASVRDYTKQLNLDKYTLLQNDDSYFVDIGDCKVDKAKTFTACGNEGMSVLAAPKKKSNEVPIVGETPKSLIKEETMSNESEKITLIAGDLESFQKFAPNVQLNHQKEVDFQGTTAELYTAIVEEVAAPVVAEKSEEAVVDAPETVEAPVVDAAPEVAVEPAAEVPADEVAPEVAEKQAGSDESVVAMMAKTMEAVMDQVTTLSERFDRMQADSNNQAVELAKQVSVELSQYQKKQEAEDLQKAQVEKMNNFVQQFGAQVPTPAEPEREIHQKSNDLGTFKPVQGVYNPFAITRS